MADYKHIIIFITKFLLSNFWYCNTPNARNDDHLKELESQQEFSFGSFVSMLLREMILS